MSCVPHNVYDAFANVIFPSGRAFSTLPCSEQRYHAAHTLLIASAGLDIVGARAMYGRLRVVYNSFRPLGSTSVPPLEEWLGIAPICEDLSCRYEGVLLPVRYALHVLDRRWNEWETRLV